MEFKLLNRRNFIKNTALASGFSLAIPKSLFAYIPAADADVLIIGAGLSGLYSAMLLQQKKISTTVLEGSNRIGGRLYAFEYGGEYHNTGGVEVGDGYQRVIAVANKLDVVIEEPVFGERDLLLHIKGQNIKISDWENSPANQLETSEKKLMPFVLESLFVGRNNPLKSLQDWYKTDYFKYDIAFSDFLKAQGASEEAIRLIDANANTNDIYATSALGVLRAAAIRAYGGSKKTLRIKDGSDKLPIAMANSLKEKVITNKKVVSITEDKKRIEVKCEDGSSYKAKYLICTLPFAVLKNISISASLSDIQKEAIQTLPYTQITQLHFAPKKEFWKEDGLPLSMWTDGPIGRVFNEVDKEGKVRRITCWLNGKEAIAIDKLAEKEAIDLVIAELKKIRPASEDALEPMKLNSWGNNPFARGAYAHFAPGQISKFVPSMNQPAGRLFFAGEHTALSDSGMEGAMESAERVVNEVVAAIKK